MSVVLNGNTYAPSDFVGSDGRGYAETFAATGLQLFPESIFTDLTAELASATSIDAVTPGAAGGLLVSNGSAWVRATGATITTAGIATFNVSMGASIASDALTTVMSTRNTHAGTSAVNRSAFGNDASAVACTFDVYGSNHASKPNHVEFRNNFDSTLAIGTNASNDLTFVTGGGATFSSTLTVTGDTILATKTPASASATGTAGTVAWDEFYVYVCVATDTWKRAAIATW